MRHAGRRGRQSCLIFLLPLLLAACATSPEKLRGEFRYDLRTELESAPKFFPEPPDPPRYAYFGELIGERNFVRERVEKTVFDRLFEILTGIGWSGVRELELLRPQAVTGDNDGRVLVTDAGYAGVVVFDPVAGDVRLLRRATVARNFMSPSGIAFGPDQQVLVADSGGGFVARLTLAGETLPPLGEGVLKRPTGVAFDAARRRILVADTDEGNIKVFDSAGSVVSVFGRAGSELGAFNRPTHLAVWKDQLYVTDTLNSRIQVLDLQTGSPIRTIGSRGTYVGQLAIPKGVSVDGEGNVYVVESLHDHLLVYDSSGKFLLPIGGTGYSTGNFYLPAGVWVDKRNRIHVADMYNGRVAAFIYFDSEAESNN